VFGYLRRADRDRIRIFHVSYQVSFRNISDHFVRHVFSCVENGESLGTKGLNNEYAFHN
jgi:hypothetical protein